VTLRSIWVLTGSNSRHNRVAYFGRSNKFYLCTGYGDSKDYAGGGQENSDDPIRTQGMGQGNGVSPAAWWV
jgi:hypothetical protein